MTKKEAVQIVQQGLTAYANAQVVVVTVGGVELRRIPSDQLVAFNEAVKVLREEVALTSEDDGVESN